LISARASLSHWRAFVVSTSVPKETKTAFPVLLLSLSAMPSETSKVGPARTAVEEKPVAALGVGMVMEREGRVSPIVIRIWLPVKRARTVTPSSDRENSVVKGAGGEAAVDNFESKNLKNFALGPRQGSPSLWSRPAEGSRW
jgi:hypothetical protein